MKLRVLAFLASGCLACASLRSADATPPGSPPDPQASPETSHGQIAFPRPENEKCVPAGTAPYHLTVRVKDVSNAALPAAAVYMFPMGALGGALITSRTNEAGYAVADATQPGVYAVVAAVGGFVPQVRALTLRAGCSGSFTFTLKVGPVRR